MNFQKNHLLNEQEVLNIIIAKNPGFADLQEKWKDSPLGSFTLTSVGIAIAHANIRRKSKEQYNIATWIN